MVEESDIMKTGTTTLAIVCKDGAILCADRRVTSGYQVAYKKFEKVVKITDKISVTVAGTVSDVQLLVSLIKAELKLKSIRTGRENNVKQAVNLLKNMVYNNIRKFSLIPGISHFIMGGVDDEGVHVYDIGADGSTTEIDEYVSSGSGSVYALGVLETLYRKDMTIEEGIKVGVKSINAALQRDIASGNGIDMITITKDGVKKVMSKAVNYSLEV